MGPEQSDTAGDCVSEAQEGAAALEDDSHPGRSDTERPGPPRLVDVVAARLQQQINAICAEIGALEFNHREQLRPRYERVAHLSRELNDLGASQ
jgi:hypothetical protein